MSNNRLLFLMSNIDNDLILELTIERERYGKKLATKNKPSKAVISCVAAAVILICVFISVSFNHKVNNNTAVNITDITNPIFPMETETSLETTLSSNDSEPSQTESIGYFSLSADKLRNYDSFDDLATAAEAVVAGESIESTVVFRFGNIYTLTKLLVTDTYKGSVVNGETIWVIERGGYTTYGEYVANCGADEKIFGDMIVDCPDEYQVVMGVDGYFPIKQGEKVLIFVGNTSGFLPDFDEPLYDIIGDTDGKLYVQEDGTYKRADPSQTDDHAFGDNELTITIEDLLSIP